MSLGDRLRLSAAVALALSTPLVACGTGTGDPDSNLTDTDADTGTDAPLADAGDDAPGDAGTAPDVPPADAGSDITADAATDAVPDATADAPDAPDTDSDTDSGTDSGTDADSGIDTTPALCAGVDCGPLGSCDATTGTCLCDAAAWFDGASCRERRDCDRDGTCEGECPMPTGPRFGTVAAGEVLRFAAGELPVEVAVVRWTADIAAEGIGPDEIAPEDWAVGGALAVDAYAGTTVRVFARAVGECEAPVFNAVYHVQEGYSPAAEQGGSAAVPAESDAIVAWATEVVSVTFGTDVIDDWRDTDNALGPAEGTSFGIVSLGRGGAITLGFDAPIADAPGADFVVFENSFHDQFLELGVVGVSSDGAHFVDFDVASNTAEPLGAFDLSDPTWLGQFAGNFRGGFGSPFDLAVLRQHPDVRAGRLNLAAITHVRVVDVIGDGRTTDSYGRPIYDPYPTVESAGFDLDGVGVLHEGTP